MAPILVIGFVAGITRLVGVAIERVEVIAAAAIHAVRIVAPVGPGEDLV